MGGGPLVPSLSLVPRILNDCLDLMVEPFLPRGTTPAGICEDTVVGELGCGRVSAALVPLARAVLAELVEERGRVVVGGGRCKQHLTPTHHSRYLRGYCGCGG